MRKFQQDRIFKYLHLPQKQHYSSKLPVKFVTQTPKNILSQCAKSHLSLHSTTKTDEIIKGKRLGRGLDPKLGRKEIIKEWIKIDDDGHIKENVQIRQKRKQKTESKYQLTSIDSKQSTAFIRENKLRSEISNERQYIDSFTIKIKDLRVGKKGNIRNELVNYPVINLFSTVQTRIIPISQQDHHFRSLHHLQHLTPPPSKLTQHSSKDGLCMINECEQPQTCHNTNKMEDKNESNKQKRWKSNNVMKKEKQQQVKPWSIHDIPTEL